MQRRGGSVSQTPTTRALVSPVRVHCAVPDSGTPSYRAIRNTTSSRASTTRTLHSATRRRLTVWTQERHSGQLDRPSGTAIPQAGQRTVDISFDLPSTDQCKLNAFAAARHVPGEPGMTMIGSMVGGPCGASCLSTKRSHTVRPSQTISQTDAPESHQATARFWKQIARARSPICILLLYVILRYILFPPSDPSIISATAWSQDHGSSPPSRRMPSGQLLTSLRFQDRRAANNADRRLCLPTQGAAA